MANLSSLLLFLCLVRFKSIDGAIFENVTLTLTTRNESLYIHGEAPRTPVFIESDNSLVKYVNDQPFQDVLIENQTIPELGENSVADLPLLEQLTISSSGLKSIQPGAFRNLPSLKRIEIIGNDLEEIKDGVFTGLNISSLNLQNNKISKIGPKAFNNMTMRNLVIDHNRISTWNSDWFTGTPLDSVHLGHNLIEELPANSFEYAKKFDKPRKNFWYVILNDNKLKTIHSGAFNGLTTIGFLNFQNNSIETLQPGVFDGVSYVDDLEFQYNKIAEIKDELFGNTELGFLKLQHNKLTCLSVNITKTRLLNVNLDYNPITCSCVKSWKTWKEETKRDFFINLTNLTKTCIS